MKNFKYLFLPLIFIVSSCYIYKPYVGGEVKEDTKNVRNGNNNATSLRATKETDASKKDADAKKNAMDEKNKKEQAEKERIEKERIEKERIAQEGIPAAKEREAEEQAQKNEQANANKSNMTFSNSKGETAQDRRNNRNKKEKPASTEGLQGLKAKIQANKYYKISVADKQYKIQADKWEGDTLVSHILRKPKKVLKFHENQINEETLEERVFSKPFSDIFTVGAYVGAGAAVLLLFL